ncbi:MAG: prepilin-type N-terminal cleavage/methylation domain-containing protein [Planctomycetaceae bacterium]|nr:prepilin-type N-terminal cleavage/methylation domain-containing protein [Planctomycetaceae bacterium]
MTVKNPKTKPARRGGFTLVEMLTVIVIIGILAGLITGATIAARKGVLRGIIVADVKQVEMGLQNYKSTVGELPPDFAFCDLPAADPRGPAARARVVRHLRKAFPQMRLAGATDEDRFAAFLTLLSSSVGQPVTAGPAKNQLNPSTALTFWLGGIPDASGKPKGFSTDPSNPFKGGEPRTTPYYDFDLNRMDALQLMQPNVQPRAPYVYFRAIKNNKSGNFEYGDADDNDLFRPFKFELAADNYCVPYLEDAYDPVPTLSVHATTPATVLRVWREPEGYQIIAPGLDGVFSTSTPGAASPPPAPYGAYDFRFSKVGQNFSDGDFDNLTNFAKSDLESEM